MIIKINGKDEVVDAKLNLAQLVSNKNLSSERVVIEYNLRIARKEEWLKIILHEGDTIEIISFMGGG